jgi:integrase
VAQENKKKYTLAKLVHHGYNMKKLWWVTFYAWDVSKGKKIRKRLSGALNEETTVAKRIALGEEMVRYINAELRQGKQLGTDVAERSSVTFGRMLLTDLVNWVKAEKKDKGYSEEYYRKFDSINKSLTDWYEHEQFAPLLAKEFERNEADEFFDFLKRERKLSNKTINNYRNNIATIFNYIEKRKPGAFKVNPVFHIEQLRTYSKKHAAFTDAQLKRILEYAQARNGKDQYLLFIQFIYYALARPKELQNLKISDIDLNENRILFRAEISKNRRDEYVTIAPTLAAAIKQSNMMDLDRTWYVFGRDYKPGKYPIGRHYYGKINSKVLKALKLDDKDYTMYGFKHSGAVALYRATKDIKLVQFQCRHTSSTQTDIYLRDLGEMTNYNGLQNFKGSL